MKLISAIVYISLSIIRIACLSYYNDQFDKRLDKKLI